MSEAQKIDVMHTKMSVTDPTKPKGEEVSITGFSAENPATVTYEGISQVQAGDIVDITGLGPVDGAYYVLDAEDGTVSLAADWTGKNPVSTNAKLTKGRPFLEDNFCELTQFQVGGSTYESREWKTLCGTLRSRGARTEGQITISFLLRLSKPWQQAFYKYDKNGGKLWIKLEFPSDEGEDIDNGMGLFHGEVVTGFGFDGTPGEVWNGSITIQQDQPPVLILDGEEI